jgi:hypothetical protein
MDATYKARRFHKHGRDAGPHQAFDTGKKGAFSIACGSWLWPLLMQMRLGSTSCRVPVKAQYDRMATTAAKSSTRRPQSMARPKSGLSTIV